MIYFIQSADHSDRYVSKKYHGVYDTLELAKKQLPIIWKSLGWQGEPNIAGDMFLMQTWGEDKFPGYQIAIEKREMNIDWYTQDKEEEQNNAANAKYITMGYRGA